VQRQRQGKSDLSVTGTRRVIIIRKFASERNLQIGLTLAEVLITKLGMYIVFFRKHRVLSIVAFVGVATMADVSANWTRDRRGRD